MPAIFPITLDQEKTAALCASVHSCLRVLRAQDNHLRSFPSEFEMLTALEELCLGGNRLRDLPTSLGTLQQVSGRVSELLNA